MKKITKLFVSAVVLLFIFISPNLANADFASGMLLGSVVLGNGSQRQINAFQDQDTLYQMPDLMKKIPESEWMNIREGFLDMSINESNNLSFYEVFKKFYYKESNRALRLKSKLDELSVLKMTCKKKTIGGLKNETHCFYTFYYIESIKLIKNEKRK